MKVNPEDKKKEMTMDDFRELIFKIYHYYPEDAEMPDYLKYIYVARRFGNPIELMQHIMSETIVELDERLQESSVDKIVSASFKTVHGQINFLMRDEPQDYYKDATQQDIEFGRLIFDAANYLVLHNLNGGVNRDLSIRIDKKLNEYKTRWFRYFSDLLCAKGYTFHPMTYENLEKVFKVWEEYENELREDPEEFLHSTCANEQLPLTPEAILITLTTPDSPPDGLLTVHYWDINKWLRRWAVIDKAYERMSKEVATYRSKSKDKNVHCWPVDYRDNPVIFWEDITGI